MRELEAGVKKEEGRKGGLYLSRPYVGSSRNSKYGHESMCTAKLSRFLSTWERPPVSCEHPMRTLTRSSKSISEMDASTRESFLERGSPLGSCERAE